MRLDFHPLCLAALFSLVLVPGARAQSHQTPQPTPSDNFASNGTIYVQVVPAAGTALNSTPIVSLTSTLNSPVVTMPEQIGHDVWRFGRLPVGTNYIVEVRAEGYLTKQEYVSLSNDSNASASIRVHLTPSAREGHTFSRPTGNFVLSPRAQREMEKAVKDLKSSKTSNARKHLRKALQMAPGHPRLNYLMGWSYLHDHETNKAIPYLAKSVSMDPSQVPARLALATVRYRQGNYSATIDLLKVGAGKYSASWEVQWILAASYLHLKNYEESRRHAEASLKADKKAARRARLILGEALAGLGQRQQAIKALETFLKENPHDPETASVRAILARLRKVVPPSPRESAPMSHSAPPSEPARVAAGKLTALPLTRSGGTSGGSRIPPRPAITPLEPPTPPAAVPHKETWAPPDVDSLRPRVISHRTCPLPSLLKRAGRTTVAWLKDLQEFTATEDYQSVRIDHRGTIEKPFQKRFAYMVFIRKPRPDLFAVDEMRRPAPNLVAMGTPLVSLGAPALALVFHPIYARDFAWSCEGLGAWKGRPAWVVRFAQRADRRTTNLESFVGANGVSRLLPLKGIAWLSEKGDHVVHLETDLVKAMQSTGLDRQHFSIDYKQVAFRSHPVKLWVPESVDLYITFRGHSYHDYSHYSHFLLFWTGTKEVISPVKHGHSPH